MRTALAKYALLETRGLFTSGPGAMPREVIVKFGEATLILFRTDGKPIEHWALASLRAQPGGNGLLLLPGLGSVERLEIADPDMISAIRAVCPDLEQGARPSSRWGVLLRALGLVVILVCVGIIVVPILPRYLAPFIPPAREAQMGAAVLEEMEALLGRPGNPARRCSTPEGERALSQLAGRLRPGGLRLVVLSHPGLFAAELPGPDVVVLHGLILAADSPEDLAAALARPIARDARGEATRLALDLAGVSGLPALLRGRPEARATLARVAAWLLAGEITDPAHDAEAAAILRAAGLPEAPGPEFRERLVQALPPRLAPSSLPPPATGTDAAPAGFLQALDDQDWIALRGICDL